MSDKPLRAVVTGWQFHTLSVSVEKAKELGVEVNTDTVTKMTATVVKDELGKWVPGDHMTSSIVVNFDEEKMIVETMNSIYHLEGEAGDCMPDLGDGVLTIFY